MSAGVDPQDERSPEATARLLTAVMGVIFTAHVMDAHWRPAWARFVVMAVFFGWMVLKRGSLHARLPWVLVLGAMTYVLSQIPYRLGNHHFVLCYVALAMILCAGRDARRFLDDIRTNLRWMLVAIMTIATVHRFLSPTFLDGSFIALMFARGAFFEPIFALSDTATAAFEANTQAMVETGRVYPRNMEPPVFTAPFGAFELACQAFVILILLGEIAIAAAFAFFRSPWIRHGTLLPFAATLGIVRAEFVFASILCMFGLSQCEPEQLGLRRTYATLAVLLTASIYFTPIELWT